MSKPYILDITTVCHSFPEAPEPNLERTHIINSIDSIFEGNTEVIVVEGEGLGKTNILSQFAIKHKLQVICLFVKPTSRWSYDPAILRYDIGNQLEWFLRSEEIHSVEDVDDGVVRSRIRELHRRVKHSRKPFFFVVDGLGNLPRSDESIQKVILDMLPFGLSGFKFLLSGDTDQLASELKELRIKPFPLSTFTPDETARYLTGFGLDADAIHEIYQTCQGKPVHLASVRRILQSGSDVSALLQHLPTKLPALFELEWQKATKTNENLLNILAIVAGERRKHFIPNLARITGVQESSVETDLSRLSFVTVDLETKEVKFVSEAFRAFASDQLKSLRGRITDLLIDSLIGDPSSEEALTYLPSYLEQADRFDELFHYLSPNTFAQMLERSQSLTLVQQKAKLGLSTARRLGRDADLIRFSMQKSALQELGTADIWRSEVTARMAVKDYDSALSLAQNTVLRIERLHLLSVIAKAKRKQGIPIDPELSEQIKHLYNQIDVSTLGERALEIASDLLYTYPDLAVELVEKANTAETGEQALDWALARLSISALMDEDENEPSAAIEEDLGTRIKNPVIRKFTSEISVLFRDYSANQVIAEIENVETPKNAIYLLRQWAITNREHIEAAKVVDFALKYAIRTTAYVPNARDLREIAAPLPFLADTEQAKDFVSNFDAQKDIIADRGPTEDFIRLQLLLAETEVKYDSEGSFNRFDTIYSSLISMADLATRAECFAFLAGSLGRVSLHNRPLKYGELCGQVERSLKNSVEQLLRSTADHYSMTRGVIGALARNNFDLAFDITDKLNVEPRRDYALLDLIEAAIDVPDDQIRLDSIQVALLNFADQLNRDQALLKIIERLSQVTVYIEDKMSNALQFIDMIPNIANAGERCYAFCMAYKFLFKQNADKYVSLQKQLLTRLALSWQSIDVGWHKIDLGFRIVANLADTAPDDAKQYLHDAEILRDGITLDTRSTAESYLNCIRLAIRAYSGLLVKQLDTEEDASHIRELIERIPSNGEQSLLWGDLALYYAIHKRMDNCRNVVSQDINPLLDGISDEDTEYKALIISRLAPALYVTHHRTAFDKIETIEPSYQEKAYQVICYYLLRRKLPTEPYDFSSQPTFAASYDDLADVCEVINRMEVDAHVFYFIKAVVNTAERRNNPFSQQQKIDIVTKLEHIINSKLPNPKYIQHEGFKIAAQAQLEKLRLYKLERWTTVVEAARKINNTADQALVLCMIASAMPSKESRRREQVLEEARLSTDRIAVAADRIDRYEALAGYAMDIDAILGRKYLRLAMAEAAQNNAPDKQSNQRRIIDIAYRIDADFAASLSSLIDDDPARQGIDRYIRVLEMKKALTSKEPLNEQSLHSDEDYADLAWKLLSALNADRINDVPIDRTRKFVEIAANLPLSKSYLIYSWVIQNAIRRFANTPHATTYLRPMFDATITASELARRMAERSSLQIKRTKRQLEKQKDDSELLVKAGEQDKALDFLRNWFEHEVGDYLKICDQFFGPEDLDILKLLKSIKPNCRISILTSRKHHAGQIDTQSLYEDSWRSISDEDPPETEILIAGLQSSGKSPIHDRWWFTSGAGLKVGTSFNSLGITQDSTITRMSLTALDMLEHDADQYFNRKREYNGERLSYNLITL